MFLLLLHRQTKFAMYQALTFYHSIVRWLVLASILYTLYRAYKGYRLNSLFSKTDNILRSFTVTVAHIQLVIGIILYTQSPIINYFWHNIHETIHTIDLAFFGIYHIALMLTAIVIITIGSAVSKRKTNDREKFKTILIWFSISVLILLIAIPWPFSPIAHRPYFR